MDILGFVTSFREEAPKCRHSTYCCDGTRCYDPRSRAAVTRFLSAVSASGIGGAG